MGYADFSKTIRQHILDRYKTEKINLGSKSGTREQLGTSLQDSTKFRSAFTSGTSGHSSILTREGIDKLSTSIINGMTSSSYHKLVNDILRDDRFYDTFVEYVQSRVYAKNITKLSSIEQKEGKDSDASDIKISNINQEDLRNFLKDALATQLPTEVVDGIMSKVHSGHLAGVLSSRFKIASGVSVNFGNNAQTYRDFTVEAKLGNSTVAANYGKAIESVLKGLLDADYLTSNLISKEEVFLKATKVALGNQPKLTTELQFSTDNVDSGRALAKVGQHISTLIEVLQRPQTDNADIVDQMAKDTFERLALSLKPLLKVINEAIPQLTNSTDPNKLKLAKEILINNETIKALIKSKGSPSFKEGIKSTIEEAIRTGKISKSQTSTVSIKDISNTKNVVTDAVNSIIKEATKSIKSVKTKMDAAKNKSVSTSIKSRQLRSPKGQFTSLTNLQTLINRALNEQISKNMGDGTRSDILNYRTGRFAASAAVQRITQSREGMLTAFYTYMKYPYQTFQPGFKQGTPASRNPKLLISKSIREIATSLVTNKLRAVLV